MDGSLNLPNLIIAGVGKAGTTSLFRYLGQHPEICPSRVKEVGYFSPLRFGSASLPPVGEYESYFSTCGAERWRMEATPDYCYGGKLVVDRIKQVLGSPRIIISLRDPVDRFWSNFKYLKSRSYLDPGTTLESFLNRCVLLRASGDDITEPNRFYRALSVGFYVEYLTDWFEGFGDDLRIVFFESLAADPRGVTAELCRWLGLDTDVVSDFDYAPVNETLAHRWAWLQGLVNRVNERGRRVWRSQPRLQERVRSLYVALNKGGQSVDGNDTMNDSTRGRLQDLYAEANEQLAGEMRRRGVEGLPGWLLEAERSETG
jgi:hypothetical protein